METSITPVPCAICGGDLRSVREGHEVRIGQRTVTLETDHLKCAGCGETFFAPDQLDELQRRASDTVRREEGLLSPSEIRRIRIRLGLSQAQFERLLGAGPKTVVRWEKGTVFQNGATDSLLRLVGTIPQALHFLAKHHDLDLSRGGAFKTEKAEPVELSYHYVAGPSRSNVLPFDRASRPELPTVRVKGTAGAAPIYEEAIG